MAFDPSAPFEVLDEAQTAAPDPALSGARVTSYGYASDPNGDSASLGRGAFRYPTGAWDNRLSDTSFAASPDIETYLRQQGVNPKGQVRVTFDDGSSEVRTWDDRTAQDSQILAGKVPGVTKPLRGRVDFFSSAGPHPLDGRHVLRMEPVSGESIGQWQSPTGTSGFDPAKPFEVVNDQPAPSGFNPSAPFEVVAEPRATMGDARILDNETLRQPTVDEFMAKALATGPQEPTGTPEEQARAQREKQLRDSHPGMSPQDIRAMMAGDSFKGGVITPSVDRPFIEIPKPEATSITGGVARGTLDMVEGLETPKNAMIAAGSSVLPPMAQKLVGMGFGADMMRSAPDEVNAALTAKTPGEAAQHWTRAALAFIGGGAIAAHSVAGRPVTGGDNPEARITEPAAPVAVAPPVTPADPVAVAEKPPVSPPAEPPLATNEPTPIPTAPPVETPRPTVLDNSAPEVSESGQPANPPERSNPDVSPSGREAAGVAPESATSVKNDATDIDRTAQALQPAGEPERRPWTQVDAEAREVLTKDPATPDRLITELEARPRQVSDTESAVLAYRWSEAKRTLESANDAVNNAYDAGDPAALEAAKATRDQAETQVQRTADVLRAVGTKAGQGLAARKMFNAEDYSLAGIERNYRAKAGGRPLTEEESAWIRLQHQKIKERAAEVEKHEASKTDQAANDALGAELVKLFQETKSEQEAARPSRVRKIADTLKGKADKAREFLRQKQENPGAMSGPLDPLELDAYITIGAAHIAEGVAKFEAWASRMAREFGDKVKPHLQNIFDGSKKRVLDEMKTATEAQPKDTLGKLRKRLEDGGDISRAYVRKLARDYIASGIEKRDELVNAVHKALETVKPGITRSEARDLLSGYGETSKLPTDDVSVKLRAMTGELQQIAKIEDMRAGQAPKKTGPERRTPSDAERALIKEVEALKKKGGYNVTDPATQLKTALEAVRTRLKNELRDIAERLDTGRKPPGKTPLEYDEQTKALKEVRDRIKRNLQEIEGKPEMSDADRLKVAQKALETSIAEYERRIRTEDVAPRGPKTQAWSPEVAAMRARRNALKAQYDELKSLADDVSGEGERRSLAAYKTRVAKQIEQLHDRLAREDFGPRPKKAPPTLDAEGIRLKAALERQKTEFLRGAEARRLADRTTSEKVIEAIPKWKRAFVLSGVKTLAKLTSAAAEIMAFSPIEEVVGGAIGKVIPGVAKRAPRHGGFSLSIEGRAIVETVRNIFRDIGSELKHGQMDIDAAYGKKHVAPRELKDFIGAIHGALKAPARRNEFTRAFAKRLAYMERKGIDVSDPAIQEQVALAAYHDAAASIFTEDNQLVKSYKAALATLEAKNKATGEPRMLGKMAKASADFMLPVVKIPTNIVWRSLEYSFGTIRGGARLVSALRKGLDQLQPEEADAIMKNLKRGSLGAAMLALGFFNQNNVGGYYQHGEKRNDKDVKYGGVRLFGVDIPRYLIHNPLLEQLQIGATARRVMDSKLHKHDAENQGLIMGIYKGLLGLFEEVPFVGTTLRTAEQVNTPGKLAGETAKSAIIPQGVQQIAEKLDERNGQTVKRSPGTFWQYVESGIPGLRKNVPEAKPKR